MLMRSWFIVVLFFIHYQVLSIPKAGFYLPDSLQEFSISYQTVDNLVILPFTINGTNRVNLILDTGCRNLVLFGKRHLKDLVFLPNQTIKFSGMGEGSAVEGKLSLENTVAIGPIDSNRMPIIVVPQNNLFRGSVKIDGLIGYEIFTQFALKINPADQTITFSPITEVTLPEGFQKVPFTITDSKPILNSIIHLHGKNYPSELMIDTGSSLELLIKSTQKNLYNINKPEVLGQGINGYILGSNTQADCIELGPFLVNTPKTGIIDSPYHDYASIGMGTLKNYIVIINYSKSFIGFKKIG